MVPFTDNPRLFEGRVDYNEPGPLTWVDAYVCLRQGRYFQQRKLFSLRVEKHLHLKNTVYTVNTRDFNLFFFR